MIIKIKPLSVNKAWQGRRFKTQDYKNYELELLSKLPKLELPKEPYFLKIKVGFSSKAADLDNVLKPFLDVLQKRYNFNDKEIYKIEIEKEIIKKGNEFISFEIKNY